MSGILLSEAHARELLAWARAARPREACGLLLGRLAGDVAIVERVLSARNVAEGDGRFEVDPLDHLAAQRAARETGRQILGAWHSHVQGPAEPSRSDVSEAIPGWAHVIVDARTGTWRAWVVESAGSVRELERSPSSADRPPLWPTGREPR